MKKRLLNPLLIGYLLIYLLSAVTVLVIYHLDPADLLAGALITGLGFSVLSYLLVRGMPPAPASRPSFPREPLLLLALVIWMVFYLTAGGEWSANLIPRDWQDSAQKMEIVRLIRKLVVFVGVPFYLYFRAGFSLPDFGFRVKGREALGYRQLATFGVLALIIAGFEYFLGGGARPLRNGQLSSGQLLRGLPLVYSWMAVEAGLVEEFFFRALLQSRLVVILKSELAGILVSGLIFGLAHAPGLYLRGSGSEEGLGQHPSLLFCITYCILILSSAGFFLGIVWQKTKNIYLVIALHAMVDVLPNASEFIHTWHL